MDKIHIKPIDGMSSIQNEAVAENRNTIKTTLTNINESLTSIQQKKPLIMSKGGIPLLYDGEDIYVDASDSHSLVIGSTGSKKTRLVVLPLVHMLCRAEESMIISDPKGEIYNRTAHLLTESGYKVSVLDFRNPSLGEGWNPLAIPFELYKMGEVDRAFEFINDIALNLMLQDKSEIDPFWNYSASDLLFGLILLAFKQAEKDVSFTDVLRLRGLLFENERVDHDLWNVLKNDLLIYHSLIGTVEAPDRTRTSILSTFDQKMRIFVFQESLITLLEKTTFSLDTLGYEKSAVFLIMPDEKTTYHRLISVFIKQCYERLIFLAQENDTASFPKRINYVLDEFSSLPTINDFPAMITAARSRNIRFFLFVQSQKQLEHRYDKEAVTIEANCNNWVFLTSRELSLLETISRLAGETINKKPLVSIFALQHLSKEKGEALVFSGRLYPFITQLKDISELDNDKYDLMEIKKRDLVEGDIKTQSKTIIETDNPVSKQKKLSERQYLKQQLMKELFLNGNQEYAYELGMIEKSKSSCLSDEAIDYFTVGANNRNGKCIAELIHYYSITFEGGKEDTSEEEDAEYRKQALRWYKALFELDKDDYLSDLDSENRSHYYYGYAIELDYDPYTKSPDRNKSKEYMLKALQTSPNPFCKIAKYCVDGYLFPEESGSGVAMDVEHAEDIFESVLLPNLSKYEKYAKRKNEEELAEFRELFIKGYEQISKCYSEGIGVKKDSKKSLAYKKRLSEILDKMSDSDGDDDNNDGKSKDRWHFLNDFWH